MWQCHDGRVRSRNLPGHVGVLAPSEPERLELYLRSGPRRRQKRPVSRHPGGGQPREYGLLGCK